MIGGIHAILYSRRADEVRRFFQEVLEFPSVNAGQGWLIFALPPAELAVHPAEGEERQELFLMCMDIKAEVERLQRKGVTFATPIQEQRWGLITRIKLPDGSMLGLYEPRHPAAIKLRPIRKPPSTAQQKRRKREDA